MLASALVIGAAIAAFGAAPPASPQPAASAPAQSASPSFEPVELSADQIMINAEKATRRHPDPPYITYQMHEIFVHHWQTEVDDYRVWYRTLDGKGLMQSLKKNRWGQAESYFGYPFPSSPDNNILLYATPDPVSTPPPPLGSPNPRASGATAPPLIEIEPVVGDRYYSVKLVGVEDYNGRSVYHLSLRALRDEVAHPWKDLWVDTSTFEVWKAHANARGSRGPGEGTLDALVEFAQVGPYWLVSHAIGDGAVHVGPFGDSGHYEYTFTDFGFPPSVPDWYFDPKLFKQHH